MVICYHSPRDTNTGTQTVFRFCPKALEGGSANLCSLQLGWDAINAFLQGGNPVSDQESSTITRLSLTALSPSAPLTNTISHPQCQTHGFEGDVTVAMATQDGQLFIYFWALQNFPCLLPMWWQLLNVWERQRPARESKTGRQGPAARGKRPRNQVPTARKNQELLINSLWPNFFLHKPLCRHFKRTVN